MIARLKAYLATLIATLIARLKAWLVHEEMTVQSAISNFMHGIERLRAVAEHHDAKVVSHMTTANEQLNLAHASMDEAIKAKAIATNFLKLLAPDAGKEASVTWPEGVTHCEDPACTLCADPVTKPAGGAAA